MAELHITSAANPRVKSLVALRRRRVRDAEGRTLVDGVAETALAVEAGVLPVALYYCPELFTDAAASGALVSRARHAGSEVIRLSREPFDKASYREGPDGILAVFSTPGRELTALTLSAMPFLLVCERIEKPGNLGAMLRTAEAAGVDAVIAVDPVTDWGNPNVVRASKGTVFSVPVASATTAEVITWLAERDYALVATTPDTDVLHTDSDLTGAIAVAVGTEKYGLDEELFAASTLRVRIPMAGQADSLNAATAAAIVLFEAVRQRG